MDQELVCNIKGINHGLIKQRNPANIYVSDWVKCF